MTSLKKACRQLGSGRWPLLPSGSSCKTPIRSSSESEQHQDLDSDREPSKRPIMKEQGSEKTFLWVGLPTQAPTGMAAKTARNPNRPLLSMAPLESGLAATVQVCPRFSGCAVAAGSDRHSGTPPPPVKITLKLLEGLGDLSAAAAANLLVRVPRSCPFDPRLAVSTRNSSVCRFRRLSGPCLDRVFTDLAYPHFWQGIGTSSLKNACRRLGVRRWPYSSDARDSDAAESRVASGDGGNGHQSQWHSAASAQGSHLESKPLQSQSLAHYLPVPPAGMGLIHYLRQEAAVPPRRSNHPQSESAEHGMRSRGALPPAFDSFLDSANRQDCHWGEGIGGNNASAGRRSFGASNLASAII